MSALANISSTRNMKQNLLANKARLAESFSGLSVTTRIDYNLRFTKQAVFVVADNTEVYSQLASQFLVTLSNEHPTNTQLSSESNQINVAFVSASSKLNDIQIRCRLIEQLFVNTLFDPEESLAVSVLRLAEQQSEPISIVIDHAQALSLQVKYELSQLVNLAKKGKLAINVVLFGLIEAGQQLFENKSLFKNKMVLIDAESAQVLGFDDKRIVSEKKSSGLSLWQKLSLLGAMLLITAVLIWLYILIVEDINEQADIANQKAIKVSELIIPTVVTKAMVDGETAQLIQKQEEVEPLSNSPRVEPVEKLSQATPQDVLQAILSENSDKQATLIAAKADDVLHALVEVNNKSKGEEAGLVNGIALPQTPLADDIALQSKSSEVSLSYYQRKAIEHEQGYVIQIAGFSDAKLWRRFIELNSQENLYTYQRLLSDKTYMVVTSKVYLNKSEAKAAITQLPVQFVERNPWLKPISSVISEINTFTR
ncbi:MAG: hypothetical protein GY928_02675 [Colwellia sp.]|nr:hypothetical protein [Colwellia sp.]